MGSLAGGLGGWGKSHTDTMEGEGHRL